jgi:glycosyltransferase involved in cell wall biosynthesis
MRISIITPSFNQGDYIQRTIESVLNQKGNFELEYVVIDGGSADRTLGVLKLYEERLQWISEKDRGQAHAVNKGFEKVTGDIIGWINSDDRFEDGAFEKVCSIFHDNPDCRWLIGRCRIIDERDREFRKLITRYKDRQLGRYSYDRLLTEDFVSQPAVFFRGSFLREVGPLDESLQFALDYDLWLRMGAKTDPVIIPDVLASFRYHNLSKTSSQLDRSLAEVRQLCHLYGRGRKDILFRGWLYRMKIRIGYKMLHLLEASQDPIFTL